MGALFFTGLGETLRMIKIEHSVFALPFALASAFLAARGVPSLRLLLLIVLAMIFARSAAMAFNRYLDAELDALNPRTAVRAIPAGRLSKGYALAFTFINAGLFLLVAWLLNALAFICAPFVLAILLGYSYTKRYTSYCHFVLGVAIAKGKRLNPFRTQQLSPSAPMILLLVGK